MQWAELLKEIFEICIIPLLGVLTGWLIKFIKEKSQEIATQQDNLMAKKYIQLLSDTVVECVQSTNQTYVSELKKQGKFDLEAQKTAFKKTYAAVMATLTSEAQLYLTNICGDLTLYITNKIEAEVYNNKMWER